MQQQSMVESSKNKHGVHIVGIGRTGAAYVEALMRTGEIEDSLVEPGSSFSAMLLDIGEDDMFVTGDYARSLRKRLESRGIPADRYSYEPFVFEMPGAEIFSKNLDDVRASINEKGSIDLIKKLPAGFKFAGKGQHTPRAIAKALAAMATYIGDKALSAALQRFAEQVKKTEFPSTVLVVFGLAGGTGSGMASFVARELKAFLPSNAKVVGVGQLSHTGDGDYYNNLSQTLAIEDIYSEVNGETDSNPYSEGFFIVNSEHSWQRLTAYTSTGVKEVRQTFKQMVTNRFVADSFVRWLVEGDSKNLSRVTQKSAGKPILFDVAKLTHPGVQVLPGESSTRWNSVLQQWISFTPKFSGLVDGFKTNYAEVHVYSARDMNIEMIESDMSKLVGETYLKVKDGEMKTYKTEFFDALTSYANVIITGVGRDDLLAYKDSKEGNAATSASSKTLESA